MRRRLIWHRRDLRLHDNWLYDTADDSVQVLSLFILEERVDPQHPIGPFALRGVLEALEDLDTNLRAIGGELLVQRSNTPVDSVVKLVKTHEISEVRWNEEPGVYEIQLSRAMRAALEPMATVQTNMQYTLYHPNDLPHGSVEWAKLAFPERKPKVRKEDDDAANYCFTYPRRWRGMCRVMGDFRRVARRATTPRQCIGAPTAIKALPVSHKTSIPSFEDLCHDFYQDSNVQGLHKEIILGIIENAKTAELPKMGETAGLSHLEYFLTHHAASATRNLADVSDFQSSRLSAYLAFGCLSPRRIFHLANQHHIDWLAAHMTMRDFFLFLCFASGPNFFAAEGMPVHPPKRNVVWKSIQSHDELWRRWALGQTGFPLVDAAMRELRQTGYCSNRVRQNVASFLTKDLEIDWREGAYWFQFLLHDHCVGANWGNWLYFSGVGPDPKHRHFRTVSQALRYDASGTYVRRFLPELPKVDNDEGHLRPWDFCANWIDTIVPVETQYTFNDLKRLQTQGSLFSNEEEPSPTTDTA